MKAYERIYLLIKKEILSGAIAPHSFLPSEHQLEKHYKASRDTVRKSLALLADQGFIQKIHGKGSRVLEKELLNFPVSGLTSYKELQASQKIHGKTIVEKLEKITINHEMSVATKFALGEKMWELHRVRCIDGKRSVLDKDYLLVSVIPHLTTQIAEGSIYEYFEQQLGLIISYAHKEISIAALNAQDRLYLDLHPRDINVVSVKSAVYLNDTTQFQYTESRHQVDRFRFVDFAQRKHITTHDLR